MPTPFPSGPGALGCWHIPDAWAGLVPRDGLSWGWRSWGGCASQWAHRPAWRACSPLQGPTTSRSRRSSCSETTPTAPERCGASGLEELWKASRAPCLLVLGFPPPASFLGVAPPMDETTLHRVGVKATGICPGDGGRKNEWVTGLGCFSWHFPLRQSRNRTFPEALAPPVSRAGHHGMPRCEL